MSDEFFLPPGSRMILQDSNHHLRAYLLDGTDAAEPVIHIKVGRNPVLHLSLEEAKLTRDFIEALLAARGQESTS